MTRAEEEIGALPLFNRYQVIVVIAVGFLCFRGSLQLYGISFIAHSVPHSCQSIQLNHTANSPVSSCPDKNETWSCTHWDYGEYSKSHSTVTQWDLVCDKAYLITLDQSIYLTGQMLGGIFLTPISDHYGRRPIIIYGLFVQLFFEVFLIFSAGPIMFIVVRFFVGCLKQTVETASYTLMAEWFSSKHRTIVSNGVLLTFSLGIMSLAGIAYFIRDWRLLVLAYNVIPDLVVIPLFFVLPESLLFLEGQKRYADVNKYLKKISRKSELDSVTRPLADSSIPVEPDEPNPLGKAVKELFSSHRMILYSLALFWLSISLNLTYYVTTMNTMMLSGNEYLNFALSGAIEMPFVLVTSILSMLLPRLVLIFGLYIVAGSAFIVSVFIPVGQMAHIVAFIGRGSIAGAYVVQILYAAEMFPTVVRNAGLGLYQIGENLGPIIGPAIAIAWNAIGVYNLYFMLGIVSLINALIVSFLPETAHQMLPEKVSDIENRSPFSIWNYFCHRSSAKSVEKSNS